uniref:Ovule protein n=1 Tax=Caenorhabditis tropicalis TaxID=1561998 RepID=A0A1I7UGD9_9PELO
MADCSDAMDHKNQGMGQEFVDISKALNKDQNKRNELSEMKGGDHKIQSRESVQNHKNAETRASKCCKESKCS